MSKLPKDWDWDTVPGMPKPNDPGFRAWLRRYKKLHEDKEKRGLPTVTITILDSEAENIKDVPNKNGGE